MKLIEYRDYEIHFADELLLIKPFRKLFNQDRTVNKEKFIQQISYLYFMIDPRSTYMYIIDEEERAKAIIEQEGLPKNFKPSKDLEEAIEIYKKHITTTSALLLQDTRVAIDKVRKFLVEVDLTQVDDKGKPIYTINNVTSAIKMIPQLAKDLAEAEKIVTKEIEEAGRARGGNNKTIMEDGILI